MLHLSGVIEESITDGVGLRYVIFTQGCPHKCIGCHNEDTHSFSKESGFFVNKEDILKDLSKNPLLSGITISGGEPFAQPKAVKELVCSFKERFGKSVWVYTGFTIEDLLLMSKRDENILGILNNIDVLVDGKFELDKRDLELVFKGSTNQRVLNVKEYLTKGDLIECL